ncbi:transposase [Streptomyces sp. NPDC001339]|uniref:transposase n=1 Tax=Streptomyces sp. NPDC001339 TaxID=3364563 RepID=UPI00368FFFAD
MNLLPIPEVPDKLGINPGTLHSWVSRWRHNGRRAPTDLWTSHPAGGCGEAERAELERLRREAAERKKHIRELEIERDALK